MSYNTDQTLTDDYCNNREIGLFKYHHSDGYDTYTFSKKTGYGEKIIELRTEELLSSSDALLAAIYS